MDLQQLVPPDFRDKIPVEIWETLNNYVIDVVDLALIHERCGDDPMAQVHVVVLPHKIPKMHNRDGKIYFMSPGQHFVGVHAYRISVYTHPAARDEEFNAWILEAARTKLVASGTFFDAYDLLKPFEEPTS